MIRDALFSIIVGCVIAFTDTGHSKVTNIVAFVIYGLAAFGTLRLMAYIADGPLFSH